MHDVQCRIVCAASHSVASLATHVPQALIRCGDRGVTTSANLLAEGAGSTSPSVMKEISEPRGCVCGVLPAQGPAYQRGSSRGPVVLSCETTFRQRITEHGYSERRAHIWLRRCIAVPQSLHAESLARRAPTVTSVWPLPRPGSVDKKGFWPTWLDLRLPLGVPPSVFCA